LTAKTASALLFALLGICIYISLRFEFRFAIAAIAALFHDVLIAAGALSLTGREFSVPVIAALLTVVGYSVNDTIVVFDRIRENLRLMRKSKYEEIINVSINQTLSRTLLTSLTTLLVVSALFFLGGAVINDFAFVLLVGLIVGTYSSVFVASPILVDWRRKH
jgi:preprotein translocase SecF subunit